MDNQKGGVWVWVLLLAVVAAVAYFLLGGGQADNLYGPGLSGDDTTDAIETELQVTDLGDLDKELQQTEADLNSL